MELFVCVLNEPSAVEDVMAGFLEIGVAGSTIIDSRGMGKIISQDIPIFGGFKNLFEGAREANVTIFSVMASSLVEEAIRVVEEVHKSLDEPSSGIVFTLPVGRVKGIGGV
ncbi:MAG: hypothetical protein HQK87_05205 [Nitrospinae bacterium]|nr:hypothetical protein [Nitrospinota bacterium]